MPPTIQDCAFMYDASGDTAMTVHSDGKARIWDIRNRTEIKQFDCGKTPLTCCAVHPNQAKIIAIGTEDAKILLYDLDSGNRIAQFSHKDWISGIEFSPDGTLLGSTSDDLTLRIWDIERQASRAPANSNSSSGWSVSNDSRWRRERGSDASACVAAMNDSAASR